MIEKSKVEIIIFTSGIAEFVHLLLLSLLRMKRATRTFLSHLIKQICQRSKQKHNSLTRAKVTTIMDFGINNEIQTYVQCRRSLQLPKASPNSAASRIT